MPIAKKSLKTLFEAMFHGNRTFADFTREVTEADYGPSLLNVRGKKSRVVFNPSERLRADHNFLRFFLVDFLAINKNVVFSYRKGFSARDAVEKHARSRYFFATDLELFFPSLTRNIVRETIVQSASLIPISDLFEHLELILDLLCVGDSLPIGFSTSPGLSNAALYRFDVEFNTYCEQKNVIYTRYADDIVMSSADRASVVDAEAKLNCLLTGTFDGALRLNHGKSKHLQLGGRVKLLGILLLPNGKISVDPSIKSEIETMLHLYLRNRETFNQFLKTGPAKTEARLAGLLNYVNTVDQLYLEKLRRKYGAAVVDMFLHRSFS